MTASINQYLPDYAVPPGWVIEERLAAQDISQAEFARRCGRSAKLISEIVAGKAPIEPKTALQFERVLGVDASIWLGIEADYRLRQTRENEAREADCAGVWSKTFPVAELVKRGAIREPSSNGEAVSALLAFFGVASVEAWQTKYGSANVAYRHSPSFESDKPALASWLRLAEITANQQDCADYDAAAFKSALGRVRGLTRVDVRKALDTARGLCNEAGVALSLVRPLPKARLSGAAWWMSPRKPVIAVSARHRTDDHLWFSFFHEAAHLLLHSKRSVFVDGGPRNDGDVEAEANEWAARFLIPQQDWRRLVATGTHGRADVVRFAEELGVAPGIVVGSLQHAQVLPWNRCNDLKVRLRWTNE
ncbi:MAG: HigA family addiction module antitoxin [Gammaproteobacteria bacterium]|nr:HigA family addiction module antitoxin [Gammaproteobacteria bacterium]